MITRNFTGHLVISQGVSCRLPVWVELRFDVKTNPLGVEMIVEEKSMDHEVNWIVGRDLFTQAVNTDTIAGDADVQLWTEGDELLVSLESLEGTATLAFPADEVQGFLDDTEEEAAAIDLDAAVDHLLTEVLG